MKLITRFIDIVLYTSLFTACCATGLCMATERLVSLSSPPLVSQLHVLVFGSTLLVYNMPRLIRRHYGSRRQVHKYRALHFFFFFAGVIMAVAGLWLVPLQVRVTSILLSLFAFAYFLPLLPFKNKKRLRDFGWIKIFVLACVWTTATSVLPVLYLQKSVSDYPLEVLLRFVFIFTLCVIFDIRDMQADRAHNINTLPHKVGIENSYRLINITLLLFAGLSFVQYLRYPVMERLAGALLTAIVTKVVVRYLRKYPTERGYLVLADGVMLVYAVLVLANPNP